MLLRFPPSRDFAHEARSSIPFALRLLSTRFPSPFLYLSSLLTFFELAVPCSDLSIVPPDAHNKTVDALEKLIEARLKFARRLIFEMRALAVPEAQLDPEASGGGLVAAALPGLNRFS